MPYAMMRQGKLMKSRKKVGVSRTMVRSKIMPAEKKTICGWDGEWRTQRKWVYKSRTVVL